jgi:hypothetical protein
VLERITLVNNIKSLKDPMNNQSQIPIQKSPAAAGTMGTGKRPGG